MSAAPNTLLGTLPRGAAAKRRLGRFELGELIARSSRTMWWHAQDTQTGDAHWLALPRKQASEPAAQAEWLRRARQLARIEHPQLMVATHAGVESGWPFVATALLPGETLEALLARGPWPTAAQAVQWMCEVLQGLAYLHEAGLAHGDVAAYSVLIDGQGHARLMPGGFISDEPAVSAVSAAALSLAADTEALRQQRDAGARDLRACGLLLHRLLAEALALDESDPPAAVERAEHEIVRLGWTPGQPVPEALRAITNRATEREPRLRYLGARSLQRALQGWLDVEAQGAEGILGVLRDRLGRVGHLPGLPGMPLRVSLAASMEVQRLHAMSELVVEDPALALELLRQSTTAQFAQDDGGVTTVRRALQLLGIDGLRRVANGVRAWPGPLNEAHATVLAERLHEARVAAHIARALCPADMDAEEAFLAALLQSLGGLLLAYHFPEEAEQIRRLVQPDSALDKPHTPSMAAAAVIGVQIESLGLTVARQWGLGERMLLAMRRVPLEAAVRAPDDRTDTLRLLAGAALEVAAFACRASMPPAVSDQAIDRVAQRYSRALVLGQGELQAALRSALAAARAPLLRPARSAGSRGQLGGDEPFPRH